MIALAEDSGLEVVRLRHMARGRGVYPGGDTHGFRELTAHLRSRRFDLVHTHSAKAGTLGRLAARRTNVPAIVHSFHGFPFHDFQPPVVRRALLATERRLARITDYFLTDGTMVAAEAVRLGLAAPERIRAIDVPVQDDIPAVTEPRRRYARDLLGIRTGRPWLAPPPGSPAEGAARHGAGHRSSPPARPVLVWLGDGDLRQDGAGGSPRRPGGQVSARGRAVDVPALLPGTRRLRDVEPVRGPALRSRRGDDLRDPGGRDGRQLRAGDRALRPHRPARPAPRSPPAGKRARLHARPPADAAPHGTSGTGTHRRAFSRMCMRATWTMRTAWR